MRAVDRQQALDAIQRMHETETITRESIVAWYTWFAHKLPRMSPERSDAQLIRTIALWMDLTDRGGAPGFPYEYKADFALPAVDFSKDVYDRRPSPFWRMGLLCAIVGLALLFFRFWIGIGLIVLGETVHYIGYRLEGGADNLDLFRKEAKRVYEWWERQRI